MIFSVCFLFLCVFKCSVTAIDCIEGEQWFEDCQSCKCNGGKAECRKSECSNQPCIPGTVLYGDGYYCQCTEHKHTLICVNMQYQPDLDEKPCKVDTYFHNTHNFCQCTNQLKTSCQKITGRRQSTVIGYCAENEEVMEDCFKCTCTKTMFRHCVLVEECEKHLAKIGVCPIYERFYSERQRALCIIIRKQDCYYDYACPGIKKCCQVTDCFNRCVNPLKN